VVLQNVVVAVLLDNFSTDSSEEESDAPKDAAASAPAASESPAGASGAAPSGGAQLVAAELPQQLEHIMNEQKLIKAQLKQILDRLGASAMEA
jgi:3-oxoacyl-ACP reductase-like protein